MNRPSDLRLANATRGFLIAIDGAPRTGKTTLACNLREALNHVGLPVNQITLADRPTADAECVVHNIIIPKLSQGEIVIADGYVYSRHDPIENAPLADAPILLDWTREQHLHARAARSIDDGTTEAQWLAGFDSFKYRPPKHGATISAQRPQGIITRIAMAYIISELFGMARWAKTMHIKRNATEQGAPKGVEQV